MTPILMLLDAFLCGRAMVVRRTRHRSRLATFANLSQFQALAGGYLGHAG
jgi:hypothetical protein